MGKEDTTKTTPEANQSFSEEMLKNFKVFHTSQMPEFNPNVHKWAEWKERLQIHFEDIACEGEKSKAATLLKSIGTEPYALLRALCDPEKPNTAEHEELHTIIHNFRHTLFATSDTIS